MAESASNEDVPRERKAWAASCPTRHDSPDTADAAFREFAEAVYAGDSLIIGDLQIPCSQGFCPMRVVPRTLLAVAMVATLSCADSDPAIEPTAPLPTEPFPVLAGLRGTADLVAGSLTFERRAPVSVSRRLRSDLVPAGIYGDQGVTVRIYNSPVTITNPSRPGKKTFSAPVGLRNLLAFPIGDEQGAGTPADTMGIYVFVNSGPTVTGTSSSCSPACTVTVQNHHGTQAFNNPSQQYWHWPERVGATGAGSDTTLARRAWVFEADTQVTGFQFDVLVSAAWARPNETRWKIGFEGDSVPHTTAEPRWRRTTSGTAGTVTLDSPSTGIITLGTPNGASHWFSRRDSVGSTISAYVEARVRRNSPLSGNPEVSFGIDDNNKFIAVGLGDDRVGFLKPDFSFLRSQITTTPASFHTYRIQKFGADSVQLLIDGTRADSRTYASFENSTNTTIPSFFYFGGPGSGSPPSSSGGNSSSWDYVIYEIGVTQP